MKEDVKNKWIEALRSGKYEQTDNRLKKDNKFCCLGVLCDISGITEWKAVEYKGHIIDYLYDNQLSALPESVMDWAGIKDRFGYILNTVDGKYIISEDGEYMSHTLSYFNDLGFNFSTIADFIEQNWETL
jgi:hypothetical protein